MKLSYHYYTQKGSIEVIGHEDEGIIITDVIAHEGTVSVDITEFIYNDTDMLDEMIEKLEEVLIEKRHK